MRKVLSVIVLGLALFPWACRKKPTMTVPPPPPIPKGKPSPVPTPIPSSIPSVPAPPTYFDVAEKYFDLGDYAKAAKAYETYLQDGSMRDNRDWAMFRLALTHILPGTPVRNVPLATNLLRQVIERFPHSPLRPQAEYLLSLQGEIERLRQDVNRRDERIRELSTELENLKKIDMERRPSTP